MSVALAAFCARSSALLCSSRYVCRFDPSLSVWAVKGARPRKYQRSCASIRTRLHCTVSMYVCMYMLRVLRRWILVFVNPPCNDAWFMHNSVTGRPVSEWDNPIENRSPITRVVYRRGQRSWCSRRLLWYKWWLSAQSMWERTGWRLFRKTETTHW